jgi:gamma-glutamylcyclotransferase (GGCT)/AIG2-like uncharacterized protein YtfP
MENKQYLFLYGSLRQGFNNPAYSYISKYFSLISIAKVQGNLVDLGSYPVGVPTINNEFITGELYQLQFDDEYDWAFMQLDDYEGVLVEVTEKPLFVRRQAAAILPNFATQTCWIYWYNGNVENKPVLASGDIFDYIKNK